jgi:hypothetical protein
LSVQVLHYSHILDINSIPSDASNLFWLHNQDAPGLQSGSHNHPLQQDKKYCPQSVVHQRKLYKIGAHNQLVQDLAGLLYNGNKVSHHFA